MEFEFTETIASLLNRIGQNKTKLVPELKLFCKKRFRFFSISVFFEYKRLTWLNLSQKDMRYPTVVRLAFYTEHDCKAHH